MSNKLIHVVRGVPDYGIAFTLTHEPSGEMVRLHRSPMVIQTKGVRNREDEGPNFVKDGEFYLVDERDEDAVLAALAEHNPGHEVRVYALEQVAQCPAAKMVVKKVSKHGVLPA